MAWSDGLKGDPVGWLLERDDDNPGVRYWALRDLVGRSEDDPDVVDAQRQVMAAGPVPVILANQHPDGFWVEPGPGYLPKYTSTVWQIVFLAQLGADGADGRVHRACDYLLREALAPFGGYSANARATGLVHCLQGNLGAALNHLGYAMDARQRGAMEWLARSITGEGIASSEERDVEPHYYRSGNSGPGFACSANDHKPCAWGAVKAMLALGGVSERVRTPAIERAIGAGVAFLLSRDPAVADYPMGYSIKPSQSWHRFGYPIGYVTDVLQNLEALTALGKGGDPRLANAVQLVLGKQGKDGRWKMEYSYNGKTWVDIERKGQPSKWVTLRALRVLKRVWEQ